jgi:hypothetical protein
MSKINIQAVLIELERPSSNERIDQLNQIIGKYLDTVEEPLNMSFWETVRYTYWSYINLTKLCDKKYDVQEDEFVKKIRNIVRAHIRESPHIVERVRSAPIETPSEDIEPIVPRDRTDPDDNTDVPPTVQKSRWYTPSPMKAVAAVVSGCVIFYAYKYFSNNAY